MLHNLIRYADEHNIKGEAGFTSKRIRFLIQFSPRGDYLGVYDYGKNGQLFASVPHLQFTGDVPTRQFLVDTVEFLILYPASDVKGFDKASNDFKRASQDILSKLESEADFKDIQSVFNEITFMLNNTNCLELRRGKLNEKLNKILKKKSRVKRIPAIKDFLKKDGVLDLLFKNDGFKHLSKHQFCLDLLKAASEIDSIFKIIENKLRSEETLEIIRNDLAKKKPKVKASDYITFSVIDGDKTKILVEKPFWHRWWKEKQANLSDDISDKMARCFLSGSNVNPLLKHPKIKGLGGVGGNAETSLISFDKGSDSFQSYGFVQGENAAVSVPSAVKYATALNHLLNRQHQQLAGAEIVYWYSCEITSEDDIFQNVIQGWTDFEEEETADILQREAGSNINARSFLRSVIDGERQDLKDAQYYALTLVGNQGRAVVQNWMEGQFAVLAQNVDDWFKDLEIPRLTGRVPVKFPKIETLITCLLKEKKKRQNYTEWVKPVSAFREAFWRAAIGGRKYHLPENTVRQVLLRYRESMLTGEFANAMDIEGELMSMRRARLYARIGLLKLYLIRNLNQEVYMNDTQKKENSVCKLGRLFAVLADLQRSAHRSENDSNVKATIVDRFYTHASTCPKLVHGRLSSLSQHHLRKLENTRPNAARAIQTEIANINHEIDFNEVPDLLALPDQSWFALGYYKQIAEMNYRKIEASHKKDEKITDLNKGENDE